MNEAIFIYRACGHSECSGQRKGVYDLDYYLQSGSKRIFYRTNNSEYSNADFDVRAEPRHSTPVQT